MSQLIMHSDVNVATTFLLTGFLLILSFTSTHQDEVQPNWSSNNHLYPTNSIYQAPILNPHGEPSSSGLHKNTVPNSHVNVEASRDTVSVENDYSGEEEEEAYDGLESYSKGINSSNNGRINESPEETQVAKTKESDNNNNSAPSKPDYYYYYDDEVEEYDNGTNSNPSAEFYDDYMTNKATSSVKTTTGHNSSSVMESIIETEPIDNLNVSYSDDEEILIGQAIVSVVTTKSVVNGTISIPTVAPMSTEQMDDPLIEATSPSSTTTEDSIIVASVQTSRSISGARFLPFDLTGRKEEVSENKPSQSVEPVAGIGATESIIDKLDRVQSELSSGLFTGTSFRSGGNALQLDVLGEQRPTPTRKTLTTTGRVPVISKFVPKRQFHDRKVVPSPTSTVMDIITPSGVNESLNFKWPSTLGRNKTYSPIGPKIQIQSQDISAFLPPGYNLNRDDERTTEKSLLIDILAKANVHNIPRTTKQASDKTTTDNPIKSILTKSTIDINRFLPPGYNKPKVKEIQSTTPAPSPIQKSLQELFSKSSVDISDLLPAGFKDDKSNNNITTLANKINESTTRSSITSTTKSSGSIKLVFPSRPGGRKALPKPLIPHTRHNDAASVPVTPKIQKGWPTRATTEFTGWPTPSTTPISIEKLLEAARTATIGGTINGSSIIPMTNEMSTTSSTTSTTTTSTTVRPTTPGYCEEECEVAGTIRIIGNMTWAPELLDRNTREWQDLANQLEKEINQVYLKSAILRKWYKNVRIDAFSPGSILVDYFVELQDLTQRINTQELRVLFHESLRTYNAHKWNETRTTKGPTRLGEFLIDPKSTDFVVIPKLNRPQELEEDDKLVPQWAIAVIVIGVGGLLFIIVFGVSVLVNRQNASKLKTPVTGMFTEEAAKNMIHASHAAATAAAAAAASSSHRSSSQDYHKSDISVMWNENNDPWREKSFESNSNKILVDGMLPDEKKYNLYDSWKSEWNGYYYQPSHSSSKFQGYESSAYSRHPPDYDTNF